MRFSTCFERLPLGLLIVAASLLGGASAVSAADKPASKPAATQPAGTDGFTATPTGLKYKDLKVGDGPSPQKLSLLKTVRQTIP